jgi:hypothetical protein
MKTKNLLSFLILLLIVNGKNLYAQKLTIEIFNKTGMDLDSVQLDGSFIGQIPNDSSILIKHFSAFEASGSWPLMGIYAVSSAGKRLRNLAKCGTKAVRYTEGTYRFDIVIKNEEFSDKLTLIKRE